jgi:hypothetical protein
MIGQVDVIGLLTAFAFLAIIVAPMIGAGYLFFTRIVANATTRSAS